jgi:hypothetical protein
MNTDGLTLAAVRLLGQPRSVAKHALSALGALLRNNEQAQTRALEDTDVVVDKLGTLLAHADAELAVKTTVLLTDLAEEQVLVVWCFFFTQARVSNNFWQAMRLVGEQSTELHGLAMLEAVSQRVHETRVFVRLMRNICPALSRLLLQTTGRARLESLLKVGWYLPRSIPQDEPILIPICRRGLHFKANTHAMPTCLCLIGSRRWPASGTPTPRTSTPWNWPPSPTPFFL